MWKSVIFVALDLKNDTVTKANALMQDIEVQGFLGKYMFVLSGLGCGQLRAVVRGSAADDGDDSVAYWPVTLLSAVIAVLTETDHPHSSGQNTFIIL